MTGDARFEDGGEAPLNLGAFDTEDLSVLAALAQDAVFPVTEIRWQPAQRRLGLLVNRLRRETARQPEGVERVQALLVVENALGVASQGVDRGDRDLVLSLLDITWEPGRDGEGHVTLVLAGDGAIRVRVEALELRLRDVTRPYRAPSGKMPQHPQD